MRDGGEAVIKSRSPDDNSMIVQYSNGTQTSLSLDELNSRHKDKSWSTHIRYRVAHWNGNSWEVIGTFRERQNLAAGRHGILYAVEDPFRGSQYIRQYDGKKWHTINEDTPHPLEDTRSSFIGVASAPDGSLLVAHIRRIIQGTIQNDNSCIIIKRFWGGRWENAWVNLLNLEI